MPKPRILRSHRQTLSVQVTQEGEILVKAPFLIPQFFIQKFLNEKEAWIQDSLAKVRQQQSQEKKYREGEDFFYLGKQYRFKFSQTTAIALNQTELLFPHFLLFRAQKELSHWYICQAKDIITKRVNHHAPKMKTSYTRLLFSDTKSKWGTCFPDNTLQFNWRLVMTPLMVIDYVVIHELAHTTEKNHSDAFWRKVRFHTPAYRQHRTWLTANAHLLSI